GDCQRQELRSSGTKRALERPYDGDDEQRECDGCKNRASEVQRRERENAGAEDEHRADGRICIHAGIYLTNSGPGRAGTGSRRVAIVQFATEARAAEVLRRSEVTRVIAMVDHSPIGVGSSIS